jgi:hypothetical protein
MAYPRTPEHNLLRALPFFLVALLLALMGWAGYRGYKSAKPRPKPAAAEPFVVPYTKLAAEPPNCSPVEGGGYLCLDPSVKAWNTTNDDWCYPTPNPGECGKVPYRTSNAFRVTRPRKHKRKDGLPTFAVTSPWRDRWVFINTIPAKISCDKLSSDHAWGCESRPLTPAEIDQYKPMTPKLSLGNDGNWLLQPHTAPKLAPTVGRCPDGTLTSGPCEAEKAAEYDQLVLDHDQDFYDSLFVPSGECTDRERYRELQCASDGKCNTRNEKANWHCLYEAWGTTDPKPAPAPSCVMPADIDVCPIQMLDPKASHD